MPLKAVGRLFKRKDGKWMLYIPKDLGDDSQFPFPLETQDVNIEVVLDKTSIIVTPIK